MTTNVLIINLHSSSNAGDSALLEITIQYIMKIIPSIEFNLVMNDPINYVGPHQVYGSPTTWFRGTRNKMSLFFRNLLTLTQISWSIFAVFVYKRTHIRIEWLVPNKIRALIQAFIRAHLVVSCPGGFIYSSGIMGFSFILALYPMLLAIILGKPLYLLPQSIGPLNHWWEKPLLRFVLKRARLIMIRDPHSLTTLNRIGFQHPKCILVPDLAFAFDGAPKKIALDWFSKHQEGYFDGSPVLGITAINYKAQFRDFINQRDYEESLVSAAEFFIRQLNGKVLIYQHVWGPDPPQDDRIPSRRIHEKLSAYSHSVMLVDPNPSPSVMKAMYSTTDLLIGTRMHSCIFALSYGVPTIMISYHHKILGLAQMLGLDEWVIDIFTIDGIQLVDMLSRLWNVRSEVKSNICIRFEKLRREALESSKIMLTDLIEEEIIK